MMEREAAKKLYETLPAPDREELWRWTNFKKVPLDRFESFESHLNGTQANEASRLLPVELPTGGELLYGEHASSGRLDSALTAQGVRLMPLTQALETHPDLVLQYLGRGFADRQEKFLAQNDAFWNTGALFYVPKNVTISQPILITQHYKTAGKSSFGRLLIILDEGARATVVHYAASTENNGVNYFNQVSEIYLQRDAQLQLVDLQNYNTQSYEMTFKRAEIGANARLTWMLDLQGGLLSKTNVETILNGPGAHAEVFGLLCGNGKQHLELCSHTQHNTPNTSANLLIKGIADDQAHTIFQGMIRIEKGAEQTDSYMANNNLVLSDKAHADSIPKLEIEADTVKASHGATIGQVDADQMFYLKTRGMEKEAAEQLLVDGFCEDVFNRITLEPIRTLMRTNFLAKRARGHDAV